MKKQVIVTTSWDDGDPLDLRVAELLRLRGLPGTFYVPIHGYLGHRTLRPHEMREMVEAGFEIGAHTYSHRSLENLDDFQLQREVRHCRNKLEDSTGRPVTMFCYPNGRYDQAAFDFVKRSDYWGARTTRMLCTDAGDNRFEIPTTLQAFPHPALTYVKNALKGRNYGPLAKTAMLVCLSVDWVELGMRMFDCVCERGGIWHLYGHSWELDDHRLWNDLRRLLDYVAHRDGVQYLTNGEMTIQAYGEELLPVEAAA